MEPIPPPDQPAQTEWTWAENEMFENAVAELDHNSPNLFEQIALRVPGKTPSQVQKHYNDLLEDLQRIESDLVPIPNYSNEDTSSTTTAAGPRQQRKKGILWTKEEHELFLMGLERFGKGDWRSISRYCVLTRTPAQVASHAQKYFIRLQNSNNNPESSTSSSSNAAATSLAPSPQHISGQYNTADHQFSAGFPPN